MYVYIIRIRQRPKSQSKVCVRCSETQSRSRVMAKQYLHLSRSRDCVPETGRLVWAENQERDNHVDVSHLRSLRHVTASPRMFKTGSSLWCIIKGRADWWYGDRRRDRRIAERSAECLRERTCSREREREGSENRVFGGRAYYCRLWNLQAMFL